MGFAISENSYSNSLQDIDGFRLSQVPFESISIGTLVGWLCAKIAKIQYQTQMPEVAAGSKVLTKWSQKTAMLV